MVVIAMIRSSRDLMVEPGRAISCGQVDAVLTQCVPYLTRGGNPVPKCCDGVKEIKEKKYRMEKRIILLYISTFNLIYLYTNYRE